ncbi:mannose-P-dolichol utilization defect 1 [Rhizophagus clarus]|uniref:Mannose-P-dolichol utilization defect 1 n=1 Tax=Rhizophagus clarus TaxID=94130 RepID=A0A8H3QHQ3_9GLOM|nr:mannose-P-dolichol utilization defect 1 [Rhizophagus clarus]
MCAIFSQIEKILRNIITALKIKLNVKFVISNFTKLSHNCYTVMILPDIIKVPAVQLIGEKCYSILVEDFNITDVDCLKLFLSKGLGFGIILASALVKLPQILKILSARSARGLSLSSCILETCALAIGLAYNFRQGNPFSHYKNLYLTGITIVVISYALGSPTLINDAFLSFLQAATIPIAISSKIPQITTNYKNGSIFNIILTIQMIVYWNVEKVEKISIKKED